MGRSRLFKISSACAGLIGLLMLGSADVSHSAILAGSCNNDKVSENYSRLLYSGGGSYFYSAAYELYDPVFGATSVIAGIRITPEADLNVNDNINLQLSGAKFNPPVVQGVPQDRLRFVLIDTDNINASDILNRIYAATTQSVSNPVNNMGFRVIKYFQKDPQNRHLYLAVAEIDANGNFTKIHHLGVSFHIDPGLDVSCDKSADVWLGYTHPRDTGKGVIIRVARRFNLVPQLNPNLTAELSTDHDFKTFIGGATSLDSCCNPPSVDCGTCSGTVCTAPPVVGGQGGAGGTGCLSQWIVGDHLNLAGLTGTVTFTLSSTVGQPGVSSIDVGARDGFSGSCTPDANKQNWSCSVRGPIFSQTPCLYVRLDGRNENNPTLWKIKDIKVTERPSGLANVCFGQAGDRSVGSWYGGLEAIVPFVKKSQTGDYNTFIKFINRYEKPAKVYAQPFKNAPGAMVIATTFVGEIPANGGVLTLDADRLATLFGLSVKEMDDGMPFKFLIRVPSQTGCVSVGSVACHVNPGDPYVEGIVVSTSPAGQRTIPLKFKFWKNGAYNH